MDVVHTERITAFHQAQEVIHIAAVVAVVKRHSCRTYALVLEDDGITLAGAMGCIGMNTNGHSGRLAGPGGSPQTDLFKRAQAMGCDPYFDDACLDTRVINPAVNFPREELGEAANRAREQCNVRRFWRKKSLAGAGDHVEPGPAGNFLQKSNIAPNIMSSQIDEGADARGFYNFEMSDSRSNEIGSATPRLCPSFRDIRGIGNVFMSEGESELGRIERS